MVSRVGSRLLLAAVTMAALHSARGEWLGCLRDVREVVAVGRQAFIASRTPYYEVARWLNAHMAPEERVAIGFNVQPFYYLDRAYYHIHPLTSGELVLANTPEEVLAALNRMGATYLAFSGSDGSYFESTAPKITAYRERLWQAQRWLRKAGRLRLITTVDGVRILKIEDAVSAKEPR